MKKLASVILVLWSALVCAAFAPLYVPAINVVSSSGGTQKQVVITTGTTYTIPADYISLVSIECIGGGGGGSYSLTNLGGGGGGGYSRITTSLPTLTPSSSVSIVIGTGGAQQASASQQQEMVHDLVGLILPTHIAVLTEQRPAPVALRVE